jgi:hypothetical protein
MLCATYIINNTHFYTHFPQFWIYLFLSNLQGLNSLPDGCNSESQLIVSTASRKESGVPDHLSKLLLRGEALDGLNQVLVGVTVTGNKLTHQRNDRERILLVDSIQRCGRHLRELHTGEDSTGLQHSVCALKRLVYPSDITDTEGDGVKIDRVVRNRVQGFRILLTEGDTVGRKVTGSNSTLLSLSQHVSVDIRDNDRGLKVVVDLGRVVEHAECDISGSSGNVENLQWLSAGLTSGVERTNEVIFPETVNSEGHDVVHGIVGSGDGGEDIVD